jgi:DNA helicase-2/ATP-dependent DNA helicase PcrA
VSVLVATKADEEIINCLQSQQNFAVIAGAGSGKTTSLITALQYLRKSKSVRLRRDDQQIACITYTNRAVDVISSRLDWDPIFSVTTLHTFLWSQIKRFTPNIRQAISEHLIPAQIASKQEEDNGGKSKRALNARRKIAELKLHLDNLSAVTIFEYNDNNHSDYSQGKLSHDDVIEIAAWLVSENKILRSVIGQRFPYIFVDEAQDTFNNIVDALNKLCENEGLPIVGYFGDPMQQIYDKRAGDFSVHGGIKTITKEENFRCAPQIVEFLNNFRTDIKQRPAGANANVGGSVEIRLVRSEPPAAPRNRYSAEQLDRASMRFDAAIRDWGWDSNEGVKYLFLARQMIARRMGFPKLQELFTSEFASSQAQEDYEKGVHFLLAPFVTTLYPLVTAGAKNSLRDVLDILRTSSPAFDPQGRNARRSLHEMKALATKLVNRLNEIWRTSTLRDILRFAQEHDLCYLSERLITHLERSPREERFDEEVHAIDKADWLADSFFELGTDEIGAYVEFVAENTPYSTQHGVKGEQYTDVVVLFDDVEAAWNTYSFAKMLTPNTSGSPTDGQRERSRKLAYVCFSRAKKNLRIVLFTSDAQAAKAELISQRLFEPTQIVIS